MPKIVSIGRKVLHQLSVVNWPKPHKAAHNSAQNLSHRSQVSPSYFSNWNELCMPKNREHGKKKVLHASNQRLSPGPKLQT